jgi:plastocyanin
MKLILCVAAVVVMAMVCFLPAMSARADRLSPRQIVLVARDMAFFREGDSTPNPEIHVRAGEPIVLTLKNADAGMTHDFAVAAWGASVDEIRGVGSGRVTLTVPRNAGRVEYICRPHSQMMRGIFLVE